MLFIQADEFPTSAYLKHRFGGRIHRICERIPWQNFIGTSFGNKSVTMTIMESSTTIWRKWGKNCGHWEWWANELSGTLRGLLRWVEALCLSFVGYGVRGSRPANDAGRDIVSTGSGVQIFASFHLGTPRGDAKSGAGTSRRWVVCSRPGGPVDVGRRPHSEAECGSRFHRRPTEPGRIRRRPGAAGAVSRVPALGMRGRDVVCPWARTLRVWGCCTPPRHGVRWSRGPGERRLLDVVGARARPRRLAPLVQVADAQREGGAALQVADLVWARPTLPRVVGLRLQLRPHGEGGRRRRVHGGVVRPRATAVVFILPLVAEPDWKCRRSRMVRFPDAKSVLPWWCARHGNYSRLGVEGGTIKIKMQGLGFNLTTDSCQQNPKCHENWHLRDCINLVSDIVSKNPNGKTTKVSSKASKHQIKWRLAYRESINEPQGLLTSLHFGSVIQSKPWHSFVIEELTTLTWFVALLTIERDKCRQDFS